MGFVDDHEIVVDMQQGFGSAADDFVNHFAVIENITAITDVGVGRDYPPRCVKYAPTFEARHPSLARDRGVSIAQGLEHLQAVARSQVRTAGTDAVDRRKKCRPDQGAP